MAWMWIAVVCVCFLLFLLWQELRKSLWLVLGGGRRGRNPFDSTVHTLSKATAALVVDQSERDRVLKLGFNPKLVPDDLDAIVIGSGIGGLGVAAVLAKAGWKCLVLEQHDQAGGCCHTFVDKGFEFDTGIHYVGGMQEGGFSKLVLDHLTDGGVRWEKLEEIYDTVLMGEPPNQRSYPISSSLTEYQETLAARFPEEKDAIEKYFALLKRLGQSAVAIPLLKLLPKWLSKLLVHSGLLKMFFPASKYWGRTADDVLGEVFQTQELRDVLCYAFGDYGTCPSEVSFLMHALLTLHFRGGGYYPRGGASEIAFHLVPTIERPGGRVMVRAPVSQLVMDGATERVVGVQVKKGSACYTIRAPLVISDAGALNTLGHLLPTSAAEKYGISKLVGQVRPGLALLSVFIGLRGSNKDLGLKASNVWTFVGGPLSSQLQRYIRLSLEDACTTPVPFMFVSFPSAKDPTYNDRYPGKATCAIITVCPYHWFEGWQDQPVMHRDKEYQGLKMALAKQLWNQVCQVFPQFEDKLEYIDAGTGLSNVHYLGSTRGEAYGIDHNLPRFDPLLASELRPEIGVPGLYLTGQDVMVCGFNGALMGALLCASLLLKRNVLDDIRALKRLQKRKSKTD